MLEHKLWCYLSQFCLINWILQAIIHYFKYNITHCKFFQRFWLIYDTFVDKLIHLFIIIIFILFYFFVEDISQSLQQLKTNEHKLKHCSNKNSIVQTYCKRNRARFTLNEILWLMSGDNNIYIYLFTDSNCIQMHTINEYNYVNITKLCIIIR